MRYKRETLQDMTRPLKQWLYKNKNNPYPTKGQKVELAEESKMTMTQVSNWFANARRRLKNTVRGQELTWETRVSMYNDCVKGNQETMEIESDDSAWESGEDDIKDSPMSDNHSQSEPTSQSTEHPAMQPRQLLPNHSPNVEPQPLNSSEPESISQHIEKAIQKELMSIKEEETKPVISKQIQDVFENVKKLEVKCEPPTMKQEPDTESDEAGFLPNAFPVSSGALSLKEQQLLSSNVSPLQHLNPTLASRLSEPVKTENLPHIPTPVTTETMASNISDQIASYLMATSKMAPFPMMPFGFAQVPFMTPQMQEELRQHILIMQAHAEELRKQREAAAKQLQDSKSQLPTLETNSPSFSQDISHDILNSSHQPTTSEIPQAHVHAHQSPSYTSHDVRVNDTHELAPSPAQSDDMAYPKSETPKFKNTLLQRYLQGDVQTPIYHAGEEHQQQTQQHPVSMVTPLNSPNHQHHSFSPLDLRKRVRNLSGSMGSQEYEDISECETDNASNGMMSPQHVVTSRDNDVMPRCPSSVFDDLAKRWREVNQGVAPTKDDEEKDDLMLKEVSAIFTLANLATSRNKSTQQS